MNNQTDYCTMHDTSLPNLGLDRDQILDEVGGRFVPGGVRFPTNFTVLIIGQTSYAVWRNKDRQPLLVADARETRLPEHQSIEPMTVLIARHGQKVRIDHDYWIIDTSGRRPMLRGC